MLTKLKKPEKIKVRMKLKAKVAEKTPELVAKTIRVRSELWAEFKELLIDRRWRTDLAVEEAIGDYLKKNGRSG